MAYKDKEKPLLNRSLLPAAAAAGAALCILVFFYHQGYGSTFQIHLPACSSQRDSLGKVSARPLPHTMRMDQPSQDMYLALQADPSLAVASQAIREEFVAAPWLLPPRSPVFDYAGVTDLDELMKIRSTPHGNYDKTITLMTFNKRFAVMTQNTIYSMVKFGGVRNYIVGTFNESDLEACRDLNLPCTDITKYLPEPLDFSGRDPGRLFTHDYYVVCWLRPMVLIHILEQGYVVFGSDSDIGYVTKPIWESFMTYIDEGTADMIFQMQSDNDPVNGGSFVLLPKPAVINFVKDWAGRAVDAINASLHDQQVMNAIIFETWYHCRDKNKCLEARSEMIKNGTVNTHPLVRVYMHPHYMYESHPCLYEIEDFPIADVCDWTTMYFHPICCNEYSCKLHGLKRQGVWFVDDEQSCLPDNNTISEVARCLPMQWRVPTTELPFYSCPWYGLAYVHPRPQYF